MNYLSALLSGLTLGENETSFPPYLLADDQEEPVSPWIIQFSPRPTLTSEFQDTRCPACYSRVVMYPYKIVECGHIVCGVCAWKDCGFPIGSEDSPSKTSTCCGRFIRNRPERLDEEENQRFEAVALRILSPEEQQERMERNEVRGIFGRNGVQNPVDPFVRGVTFAGDFDHIPTLDVSSPDYVDQIPENHGRQLFITVRRADCNYIGFSTPISKKQFCEVWILLLIKREFVRGNDRTFLGRVIRRRALNRMIARNETALAAILPHLAFPENILLLEDLEFETDSISFRLTGWESTGLHFGILALALDDETEATSSTADCSSLDEDA